MMMSESVHFEDKEMFLEGIGPFCMGADVSMDVTVECDYYPGEPMRQPTSLTDDGYPGDGPEIEITGIDVDDVTCYYDESEYEVKIKTLPSKSMDQVFDYYQVNAEEVCDKIE